VVSFEPVVKQIDEPVNGGLTTEAAEQISPGEWLVCQRLAEQVAMREWIGALAAGHGRI
jgi:hypothetical protein